jgi:hypothetical protein
LRWFLTQCCDVDRLETNWDAVDTDALQRKPCTRVSDDHFNQLVVPIWVYEANSTLASSKASQGRSPSFTYLVRGSGRSCFVKIDQHKQQDVVRCLSSKGGHYGARSRCCKLVLQYANTMEITARPQFKPAVYSAVSQPIDSSQISAADHDAILGHSWDEQWSEDRSVEVWNLPWYQRGLSVGGVFFVSHILTWVKHHT